MLHLLQIQVLYFNIALRFTYIERATCDGGGGQGDVRRASFKKIVCRAAVVGCL